MSRFVFCDPLPYTANSRMYAITVIMYTATMWTSMDGVTGSLTGILMNGATGTQVYNPYGEPHSTGPLSLNLQTEDASVGSEAVINEYLAYFASGGQSWFGVYFACALTQRRHF